MPELMNLYSVRCDADWYRVVAAATRGKAKALFHREMADLIPYTALRAHLLEKDVPCAPGLLGPDHPLAARHQGRQEAP